MQEQTPYVVGIGAANIDLHGRSRNPIVLKDSNPGELHSSAGGVTRNILENCAQQGLPCALLTAVGADLAGRTVLAACTAADIDVSRVLVKEDLPTSAYIAMMDESGDMFIGMSDMRILQSLDAEYLVQHRGFLERAAAIVCDGCLPQAFLAQLLTLANARVPVFIDPVSTAYAHNIVPLMGDFYAIKPNRMELEILSGIPVNSHRDVERAAERVLMQGTQCVVVSLGEQGCYYADAKGQRLFRKLRPAAQMANATGAGDAFNGGLLTALSEGKDLWEAARFANALAALSVQKLGTTPSMPTRAEIDAFLAEHAE